MSDTPLRVRLGQVWSILRWPVALGVLGWLVYANVYLNADTLLARSVHWGAVAGAVACFVVALLLTFLRWLLLVRAQQFEFTYGEAVQLGLVGLLFNFVAPGAVGGDIVKGSMIATRQKSRRLVAASTVVLDRALGSLGLFFIGAIAYLFLSPPYRTAFAWLAALFVAGFVAGAGLLGIALWPRVTRSRWVVAMTEWRFVGRTLKGVLDSVSLYQAQWRTVMVCILVSFTTHCFVMSTFYLCSRAVARGSAVPGVAMQWVVGAGSNFIQAFVPTPGGVGALESALAVSYQASDGVEVDTIRAAHSAGDVPPDWAPSLELLREPEQRENLSGLAERADVPPDELAATLEGLESDESASTAFDKGVGPITASTVWAAYRAGHNQIAFREGLLAALCYRVLTVLVAIVGALAYWVSRREIDAALAEREREEETSASERPTGTENFATKTGSHPRDR